MSSSLKNTYKYRTRFAKIVEVQVLHDYFLNKKARKIEVIPSFETRALIRNYDMIFKSIENGFVLLLNQDSNSKSKVFSGALSLEFTLNFLDELFLNYSDIPYTYNQKLIVSNSTKLIKLHPNTYVSENDFSITDNDEISAQITLDINLENEYFGHEQEDKSYDCLDYSIHFNSRRVVVRYNFYSSKRDEDFSGYFMTDENSDKRWNDFKSRTLENGLSVRSLALDSSVKLSELFNLKYFLKRQDEFNQSYSKYLPHPNPKNLSQDFSSGDFYCDVFVKID